METFDDNPAPGSNSEESSTKADVKPKVKQELITDHLKVEKKRKSFDRFNGTSKEELMTRSLPDRLKENLDIVFIGETFEMRGSARPPPCFFGGFRGTTHDRNAVTDAQGKL